MRAYIHCFSFAKNKKNQTERFNNEAYKPLYFFSICKKLGFEMHNFHLITNIRSGDLMCIKEFACASTHFFSIHLCAHIGNSRHHHNFCCKQKRSIVHENYGFRFNCMKIINSNYSQTFNYVLWGSCKLKIKIFNLRFPWNF